MQWEDDKVLILIELYRSKPVLWDPNDPDYKRRQKRHEALNEIATELSTCVIEVERKIKNLTSHYYREKKKTESSITSDEVYRSKWFAFEALDFLRNGKYLLKNKMVPIVTMETMDDFPAGHNSQQESDLQQPEDILSDLPTPNKRLKTNIKQEVVSEAFSIMRNIAKRQNTSNGTAEKDEDGLFGDYIAGQLRKMDASTNAIVRHRINNIIFEAETGCRADMFTDFAGQS